MSARAKVQIINKKYEENMIFINSKFSSTDKIQEHEFTNFFLIGLFKILAGKTTFLPDSPHNLEDYPIMN